MSWTVAIDRRRSASIVVRPVACVKTVAMPWLLSPDLRRLDAQHNPHRAQLKGGFTNRAHLIGDSIAAKRCYGDGVRLRDVEGRMLEGQHFQNAYVTRDIDKAIASFRDRGGIAQASSFEVATPVWTPDGSGTAVVRLAFIWIDDLQYELIEPISGPVGLYSDALPDDDSMRFHHICMRVPEWEPFRARVDAQRYSVVYEGDTGGLRFLYLDARDFLGHYLEYVWMTDERWGQLGGR